MTDYSGVTWRVNYGEISERNQFRVGYVGLVAFDAYFEVLQLADLINVLTAVQGLNVGQLAVGSSVQARKVQAGIPVRVIIEPRSDTYPQQIMGLLATDVPDLLYALGLFQAALGSQPIPDDWAFQDVPNVLRLDKKNQIQPPEAAVAIDKRVLTVGDGRYRRVLSELRSLAPGADARPIIQAAVDAASGTSAAELVIPEGDWTVSSSADTDVAIRIGSSNVVFQGAGIDKTRFTTSLGRAIVGVIGTSGTPLDNVRLSDFTVAGNASTANQRGLQISYTNNFRSERIKARDFGNNGVNLYYSDNAILQQYEILGSRDFGMLVYRSKNSKVIDAYVHDIGMGRAHLGIQFKSSQRCQAIRPRIERIQGYGLYVWDDGLDLVNYPDFGHTIENAFIKDILSGGTFNPNSMFLSTSKNITVRGGRFIESATGLISVSGVEGLVVAGIDELTGAHGAPALAVSGVSSFNIRGVNADGLGVSNELGILIAGTPKYGSVRDCRVVNGATGVSPDNAAMRLESTVTGVFIEHNDFSDYQAVKTQRRGMYDRTAAGVNYWKSNRATGNTTNKTIPAGSIDTDNVLV